MVCASVVTAMFLKPSDEPIIAEITGLSGAVLWTGDGGRVVEDLEVGTKLVGGTVEGITPDSWVELRFRDDSTVTISGSGCVDGCRFAGTETESGHTLG